MKQLLLITASCLVSLPAADSVRFHEGELPAGFAEPTVLGEVFERQQPAYRAVEGQSFWALFQHIKRHDIPMTAPVVMTMSGDGAADDAPWKMTAMRFLYPKPDDLPAAVPANKRTEVIDVPAATYLVVTLRGRPDKQRQQDVLGQLQVAAAERNMNIVGAVEMLGYNSPMVPKTMQTWEMQVQVEAQATAEGTSDPTAVAAMPAEQVPEATGPTVAATSTEKESGAGQSTDVATQADD